MHGFQSLSHGSSSHSMVDLSSRDRDRDREQRDLRQQQQAERERDMWNQALRNQPQQQQQQSAQQQPPHPQPPQPSKPPMHSSNSGGGSGDRPPLPSSLSHWSPSPSLLSMNRPPSSSASTAAPSARLVSPSLSGVSASDSLLFDDQFARRNDFRSAPPTNANAGTIGGINNSAFSLSPSQANHPFGAQGQGQVQAPSPSAQGGPFFGSSPTLSGHSGLLSSPNSTNGQMSQQLGNGRDNNGANSPSPSPSPDPFHSRANDPARIQALIQVIHQLHESGVQSKFMSQLGIIFKQLHPSLFVKGILKELVDNAAAAGLLVLSGTPGQQQVELTPNGQAIAKQWRNTHQLQNMQQLLEMKETLAQQAAQQQQQQQQQQQPSSQSLYGQSSQQSSVQQSSNSAFQLNTSSNNPSWTMSAPVTSSLPPLSHSFHSGSALSSSALSSSQHTSPSNSNANNGGSNYSFLIEGDSSLDAHAPHLAQHRSASLLGLPSTRPSALSDGDDMGIGVTDAEDSELLSSYNEQEMLRELYKSPQTAPVSSSNQHQHSHGGHQQQQHGYSSTHSQANSSQSSLVSSMHSSPHSSPVGGGALLYHSHQSNNMKAQHTYLGSGFGPQQSSGYGTSPNFSAMGNGNNGQQNGNGQQLQLMGNPEPPLSNSDLSALQLLPPLPTGLEEKTFRGEKLKHLKYIFHFRVHPCLNFLQRGSCPYDNKNECFDYHSLKTRRRIPRIYSFSNGIFWSYNACRCQAIEKDMRCEKGEACRYAHCKEEIAYHPSRYKSARCSYPLRSDGSCSRFGLHCAFSHGDHDTRKAIVLKQGMPHKLVEPAMHVLQEQQKLVAALTGLTLTELNGFSLSGHNNSMSFGANNGNNNAGSNGAHTGNGQHGVHHSGGVTMSGQQSNHVPSGMNASSSNNGMSAWEQQLQQRNALHHAQSNGSTHHLVLHTEPSPIQYDPATRPNLTRMSSSSASAMMGGSASSSLSLTAGGSGSSDSGYGTAPPSPTHGPINTDPSFLASLDPNAFICPVSDLASDRDFFLYTYKTKPCTNQTLACTKGDCNYYHFETKRRRNPRQFRYSYDPCPAVKQQAEPGNPGGWRRPSNCRLGDQCSLSHTQLESIYHPSMYKLSLCPSFDERDRTTWQRCPWKRACAHAHSRLELEYAEQCFRHEAAAATSSGTPSSLHARVASQEYVFDNDRSHNDQSNSSASSSVVNSPHFGLQQLQSQQSQQQQQQQQQSASHSQYPHTSDSDDSLPGVPPHLSALSHDFLPSPPTQDVSDDSMRSVLLRQDVAAKILRLQSNQLQPSPSVGPANNSQQQQMDALRSENAQLLERCNRYEREYHLLKLRLLEKDSKIKQMQWSIDTEVEEKRRIKVQLDTLTSELTQRFLQQQPLHSPQQQQQQQQQQNHAVPSSSPQLHVSHLQIPASSTGGSSPGGGAQDALHKGDSAAAQVAEAVLISPNDDDNKTSPHHSDSARSDAGRSPTYAHAQSHSQSHAHSQPQPHSQSQSSNADDTFTSF